jgi:putative protease
MNRIEILAPAGSVEGMRAAVNAGCDAVYMGGAKFGARAFANNPEEDDLLKAIDYVHIRGKQLYLTVNTLLKNEEVESELYNYLHKYYLQGLDAVIVQDVGVMHFIHQHFPMIPIHASTQMTLTMAEGANELKSYGVTRVVPSRELSLTELTRFRQSTDLEIEAFVHGALCYCYSGQCLMSSMIGGRSGNRGRCAQPCRMEYQLEDGNKRVSSPKESYLLSPKDMCTLPMVAQMIEAGINSFKIEGRMKRPEYAAGVVTAYKNQADLYYELGAKGYQEYLNTHPTMMKEELRKLKDLYNRGGFSTGYFDMHNGKQMMSMQRPNHSGVLVGHVVAKQGIQAEILLSEPVNAQDVLEFRHNGEATYEFTVKNSAAVGTKVVTNTKKGSRIELKDEVYRTKNTAFLDELSSNYLETEKKIPIRGYLYSKPGEPLKLTLEGEIIKNIEGTNIQKEATSIYVTEYGDEVMQALKQPMVAANVEDKLRKTNDTPFEFTRLSIDLVGDTFFPIGKLNELRRTALLSLEQQMAKAFEREDSEVECLKNDKITADSGKIQPEIIALVRTKNQFEAVLRHEAVHEVYLDLAEMNVKKAVEYSQQLHDREKKCYLLLPHILRAKAYDEFVSYKEYLDVDTIDGYVLKNFEELALVRKVFNTTKELRLDYNMYVMNEEAISFYEEQGITQYTASVELSALELKELPMKQFDLVVYGNLPLMVTAQCLLKNTSSCYLERTNHSTEQAQPLMLKDRMQMKLPLRTNCKYCYNTIYSSQCMNLFQHWDEILAMKVRGIRLDFTFEDYDTVSQVLTEVEQIFVYHNDVTTENQNNFKGHFKRGIL